MIRLCTFALSVLLMTVVHCNANPLRRQSSLCLNYQCPPMDNALYPLALDLSGPQFVGYEFLQCYYPVVSNCQYHWQDGNLVADDDSGYCPNQAPCMGGSCACPQFDNANYALVTQTVNGTLLFCTYPTALQPYIAEYFCNYNMDTGLFIYGTDLNGIPGSPSNFCPPMAIAANPSFCFSQSAASRGATVTPTDGIPSPSGATVTPSASAKSVPGSSGPTHLSPSRGSPGFHGDDLRLRIVGTAIIGVMLWQLA